VPDISSRISHVGHDTRAMTAMPRRLTRYGIELSGFPLLPARFAGSGAPLSTLDGCGPAATSETIET
jgi:hypothetical protein